MSAPTQTAGPGSATTYTAPVTNPQPTDVTRVLVVGESSRTRWALTQMWRRAGRPLAVTTRDGGIAQQWAWEHGGCGVRHQHFRLGEPFDVLLTFGHERHLSAELRAAMPLARRAGLVVDGDTVPEFR